MTSQAYLSELFSLDGRVAVVTGGSSGIGRAIGAAAELRFKETDRLATTTDMLAGFGVPAKSDAASITVRGGGPIEPTDVDGHGDHRIAMAAAVLASTAPGPTVVRSGGSHRTSAQKIANVMLVLMLMLRPCGARW
jgi:3-phosphoshikimate 1-carboxyvinyltransferase